VNRSFNQPSYIQHIIDVPKFGMQLSLEATLGQVRWNGVHSTQEYDEKS
jgi:hypothetical protein